MEEPGAVWGVRMVADWRDWRSIVGGIVTMEQTGLLLRSGLSISGSGSTAVEETSFLGRRRSLLDRLSVALGTEKRHCVFNRGDLKRS